MSAGLLDCPRALFDSRAGVGGRRGEAGPARARGTLEERLDSVWRMLQTGGVAECPACAAEMSMRSGGRGGECGGCGSRLS